MIEAGEVLCHRLAGHGHHIAVQQAGVEQMLHHHGNPADAIEIAHVELATRLHVGDVRNLGGDPVEVVEMQLDAGFVGNGEQMKNRVRRAAERRRHRNGIFERLLGHDHPRCDPEVQHVDDSLTGATGIELATRVDSRRGCTAW